MVSNETLKMLNELDKCKTIQEKFQLRPPELHYSQDEKGLSKLFSDVIHSNFRYNVDQKKWMYFNGRIWILDEADAHIKQIMKAFAEAILAYTPTKGSYEFVEKENIGKASLRKSLIRDAADNYTVRDGDFDNHPNLLNTSNRTIDLDTGTAYYHNSNHYLTQIANVKYDPNATSDILDSFMIDIFEGDEKLIQYVYRALGISLTGYTDCHCLFILLGESTRNGKSTLLNMFKSMLGGPYGYAANIDVATLAQRKVFNGSTPTSDIARLRGKRFVVANEPPEKFVFDQSRIKSFTGEDYITARFLHQGDIEFQFQGKIFIGTNHRPNVEDDSIIQSQRIRVIPFERSFAPEEQDLQLPEKLRQPEVLSALLNKCITGYLEYKQFGSLSEPEAVQRAMSLYTTQEQIIGQYLEYDFVDGEPSDKIPLARFYSRYVTWCSENDYLPASREAVNNYLRRHKLYQATATIDGKTVRNIMYGKKLKPDSQVGQYTFPNNVDTNSYGNGAEIFVPAETTTFDAQNEIPTNTSPNVSQEFQKSVPINENQYDIGQNYTLDFQTQDQNMHYQNSIDCNNYQDDMTPF